MRLDVVDVLDDRALREWYAVEAASTTHDRPDALHRTYGALAASVRHPSPYRRVELLAAHDGDEIVGTGEVPPESEDDVDVIRTEPRTTPSV